MSYILDALRRSQAERERGQVPGLNAQPAPAAPLPPPSRGSLAVWLAAGVVLGLMVIVVIALMQRDPAVPPAGAVLTAAPLLPPAVAPGPAPIPVIAPPVPVPAAVLPLVVSAPAAPASIAAAVVAPPPPASVAPRAVPLAQLTAEQRRELPHLTIGGAIWSENKASRFVIVNGQVLREGELAAPGLTLESIGPKTAVLRWREMRIEIPF